MDDFLGLVVALADYERLEPPSAEALARLRRDALATPPRFGTVLAYVDGVAVGYAISFETYSSFLALPTMYLEDLFVLEPYREGGVGGRLFDHVRDEGRRRGCGRMEWQVLDWNTVARTFYERRGATWNQTWLSYRITY